MKHEITFCPQCGARVFMNEAHFCENPIVKKSSSSGFSFAFKINLTNLWRKYFGNDSNVSRK